MGLIIMKYDLLIHKGFDKKDIVTVIDENYFPACFFLDGHMGCTFSSKAFSTRLSYGKTLLFIYRYFTAKSIELPDCVSTGRFLDKSEYDDFKRYCSYKVIHELEQTNSVISFEKMSHKQLSNLINNTKASEDKVSSNTIKQRLMRFKGYIEYLYNCFHLANNPPAQLSHSYANFNKMLDNDIRSLKEQNTEVNDPFEQAIPDKVFFNLLEITKPHHEDNPFQSNKLRNRAIIMVFVETGIRIGALAKLKICDVRDDWHNPRMLITRTPDDPTDPRRIKPQQKTKPHASSLTRDTTELLKLYIKTDRNRHNESHTHDFIFVGDKGQTKGLPLSTLRIYQIIKSLSKAVNFNLHPHLFRHKWNEILTQRARDKGYSMAETEDMRNYGQGWTENSSMSGTYNKKEQAVRIQELSNQRQGEFAPKIGGDDGL